MLVSAEEFINSFQKLLLEKPRYNLKQVQVENCEYSDTAVKSNKCYWTFGAFYSEDLLYSRYSRKCVSCSDLTFCVGCEFCVDCIDCAYCYDTSRSQNCSNCIECDFCIDCYSCNNCLGCYGLLRKEFCLFNQQLSKEEYKIASKKITPEQCLQKLEELKRKMPVLATHQFRTEDCIGNNLTEAKDCYQCYDGYALEECFYCIETNGNKTCCDHTVCFENELCYNCVHSPLNYNCNFLLHTDLSRDSEFCAYSKKLESCFGCTFLTDKKFHLLNQALSEEDYKNSVRHLRQELIKNGSYNLEIFFSSDYEKQRLTSETDPILQEII